MKTILVTGGAGFIGSHFVRHLISTYPDYNVLVLDALNYAGDPDNFPPDISASQRFSFWWGNVRNTALVDELVGAADIVVHLAAESHVARSIYDNQTFYETDVLGTQTVATAVVKHQSRIERFIHVSTSEVYGTALTEPMDEEHPLNPATPYASAKAGADRLVYSFWSTYGIPAVIVRPFNNYGANQHLEKVIPRFICSALMNKPLTIHGTGTNTRDWLHVEDHCRGLSILLHADLDSIVGQCINLGTGIDTSVLDIAYRVLEILDRPRSLIKFVGDRLGQVDRHISSTDKAKRLLGWQSSINLDQGLQDTIQWYDKNRAWWERRLWMTSVPIRTRLGTVEYH